MYNTAIGACQVAQQCLGSLSVFFSEFIYRDIMEKKMEATIVYRGCIGIMETTIVYYGSEFRV